MRPKIFAFFISLVNFLCLLRETDDILDEIILLFSVTYFLNKLTFL